MNKIKLAIDIDEILRAKWLAFDRYYADEFGSDGIKEPFDTYDYNNHYEFKEKEESIQYLKDEFLNDDESKNVSPIEYIVDDETGIAPVDLFAFKTEVKTLTSLEVFNKFLYEDFLFEIHGSAPKLYLNADIDLNVFMKKYSKYFDFVFFAKTKQEAIPATLFFLSKLRIECKNISFVYDNEEIIDQVDWILTTDPTFKKQDNKKIILIERLYNNNVDSDFKVHGIQALNENSNDFINFINNNIK